MLRENSAVTPPGSSYAARIRSGDFTRSTPSSSMSPGASAAARSARNCERTAGAGCRSCSPGTRPSASRRRGASPDGARSRRRRRAPGSRDTRRRSPPPPSAASPRRRRTGRTARASRPRDIAESRRRVFALVPEPSSISVSAPAAVAMSAGVRIEDRPLAARQVVLGQAGDGVEERRPALVVVPLGGRCFGEAVRPRSTSRRSAASRSAGPRWMSIVYASGTSVQPRVRHALACLTPELR